MDDNTDPQEDQHESLLDDWMSRAGLAGELGISIDTLGRWETRRIGPPCIRLGRRVYYRKGAVRDWLREQEPKRSGSGR
jgi:hypothetical protein